MASQSMSAAAPAEPVIPATALAVRKAIYSHPLLTPSDMDQVFDVARKAGHDPCAEWTSLFSEALTDYVVHQNDPPDYIPQEKADWLKTQLSKGGGIASKSEFAMLIDVMTSALGVPPSLSTFALQEIKAAIMNGRRDAITGEDHPAGAVTGPDVEALRAILYAATTGTVGHVTREEAEALFDIAHATAAARVDAAFDDLFARAVGNYLLAVNVRAPDATTALHREKWLDEKESMSGFLSRMFSGAPDVRSFHVLKTADRTYEAELAERAADDRAALAEHEKITDVEGAWIIAHLTRDGELTSAENRLLQFLGEEAASIAPVLRALVDKARML